MTLWPSRRELRNEVTLTMARDIMNERLWLPIYEEGGLDALIEAGEISHNRLPERDPEVYRK